jgi:hypothetical protein
MNRKVNEHGEVLMTKELCLHLGSCGLSLDKPELEPFSLEHDNDNHYYTVGQMWGKTEAECVTFCFRNKIFKDMYWYIAQRETEKFVRYIGETITMTNKYQVFNPISGSHISCESEAEAKQKIAEISLQILSHNKITVCREMSNEFGHTTWVAEEIENPITLTANVPS